MHPPLTLHRHPMCAEINFEVKNVICPTWDEGLVTCPVQPQPSPLLELSWPWLIIIEQFQKCHVDHPIQKFFGECTDLKIKLDRCFREEKAVKRKANFEESKKIKERLQAYRKTTTEKISE